MGFALVFGSGAIVGISIIILFVVLMATNKEDASPKDFFIHLLSILALYITAYAFAGISFNIINFNFPDDLFYFSSSDFMTGIRMSIASLIVALPTFLVTSKYITQEYTKDKHKRDLRIRTWLIHFTLFVTAVIILISLVTIIYQFLGGELTARFGLKVLTVLVIAGTIFGYYLYKLKAVKESKTVLNSFMGGVIALALIAIVAGFATIGSPATQRAREFDMQRLNDLATISSEIQFSYSQNEKLPASLDALNQPYLNLRDPQANTLYEYRIINDTQYELCAVFTLERFQPEKFSTRGGEQYIGDKDFTTGRNCFSQEVSPVTKDLIPRVIQ
jgi:hypothetical protein